MSPGDRENSPDEALAAQSLAGDDRAFAELARRHRGRVFGLAARFTRDRSELDDLAQEIFLAAWRGLRSFRREAPFEHWLARLAVRRCYRWLRRHAWRKYFVSRDELENPPEPRDEAADHAAGAARDAAEAVHRGLAELASKDRLVLTLLELEERTVAEIAALTGWSESNVKVRAHRAREKLRAILMRHRVLP